MKKWLFIAEKPSLARTVEACYNKHKDEVGSKVGIISFTALSGHVCCNYTPSDYSEWHEKKWHEVDYPMIPDPWGVKVIPGDYKRKTVASIKKQIKEFDGIIVGTDSDVEGYGIYMMLESYLKIQKVPALRFIEDNLTDAGILRSLLSMTDYHADKTHRNFVDAYILRSRTDWLYGMNATRVASLKLNDVCNIGRVKAPTIKLVYDNCAAIDNFKPEKTYQLGATYEVDGAQMTAIMLADDFKSQRKEKDPAQFVLQNIPKNGVVVRSDSKVAELHAPKLFDLPALQIESGLSPSDTLENLQSLYEKHKVISYPRTQCRYVSTEKAGEFKKMLLDNFSVFPDLYAHVKNIKDFDAIMHDKQVVNDKEVQKEAHDALLPTFTKPDLSKMTEKEQHICRIIYTRLLMQYLPKLKEEKVTCVIKHGDNHFLASGKTVLDQGFMVLAKERGGTYLPSLKQGDELVAKAFNPIEKVTQPPKRLTETTLLAAMMNIAKYVKDKELQASLAESKGIGTPATRDSIIKDIIARGFVDNKKGLYITKKGKMYIESLNELDILHPVFAAKIDMLMKQVQRGETPIAIAYEKVLDELHQTMAQIERMKQVPRASNGNNNGIDVSCPDCKGVAKINKFGCFCECGIKIFRKVASKELTDAQLKALLIKKETGLIKNFVGKSKNFDAKLKREDKKIVFEFENRK